MFGRVDGVASVPLDAPRALPRRDDAARAHLHAVAARAQPLVHAGDRRLLVDGPLGLKLPGRGLQRGSTVALDGRPGTGSTTVAFQLAAAATSAGEWAAVVDPEGTLGAQAAIEAGVELERCAVVRRLPRDRWAAAVAALLDGVALVAAAVPPYLRAGDARRLVARARERAAVLVAIGPWPAEAALRLETGPSAWCGLETGTGLLTERDMEVRVEGRGVHARAG
jgi:hypothetical protein